MATLIKTDGEEQEVQPRDGVEFRLDELYALVGNGCDMVQAVGLADGRTMFCDEESKVRPAQGTSQIVNLKATRLLAEAGGLPGDCVLGNVLICQAQVDDEEEIDEDEVDDEEEIDEDEVDDEEEIDEDEVDDEEEIDEDEEPLRVAGESR